MKGDAAPAIDTGEAFRQLKQVADSETFRDGASLQRLLLFLGERSLDGRADQLKEYTVGIEALGRPSHYDPRTDSSARALAAKLRRRLEQYYLAEGAADSLRIGFPKGGFKLTFEPAEAPAHGAEGGGRSRIRLALAGLGVVIVAVLSWLLGFYAGNRQSAPSPWNPELEALWQSVLDGNTPVVVSVGSPLFVNLGTLNARWTDLNDWEEASRSSRLNDLMKCLGITSVAPRNIYAGVGEMHGAFSVAKLLGTRKSQLSLRRGTALAWEDVKNNHVVFIGPTRVEQKLKSILADREFVLGEREVRNLRPRAGEPSEFRRVDEGTGTRVEYGVVSFLPGYEPGKHVIILAGNSTEAVWGTVEAVTNPQLAAPLVARLRSARGMLKAFQAVVKVQIDAGVPVDATYAAHHELTRESH
jgi:hypothetical protein